MRPNKEELDTLMSYCVWREAQEIHKKYIEVRISFPSNWLLNLDIVGRVRENYRKYGN